MYSAAGRCACSWRACFSDQHYFATLLSMKGMAPKNCNARLTTSTASDAEHAHSFTVQEVSVERCVSGLASAGYNPQPWRQPVHSLMV